VRIALTLEFDRLDFCDEAVRVFAQERGDHVEHGVTEAADVQTAEGGFMGSGGWNYRVICHSRPCRQRKPATPVGTLGCLRRSIRLDVDAD
jgi:hypothetical protein